MQFFRLRPRRDQARAAVRQEERSRQALDASPRGAWRAVAAAALLAAPTFALASSPPNTAIDRLDAPALVLTEPTRALMHDVTMAGDRIIAVGALGAAIYSDDQGQSWRQAQTPVSVDLTGVAGRADGLVVAVGHDGAILRSADRGESWERVADGRELLPIMIAAAEKNHEAAKTALEGADDTTRGDLEFALDDALFRLETAQTSMEYGPSWPFLDVLFLSDRPDEKRVLALGGYGMAFLSEDEGKSWALINDRFENAEDFHFNAGFLTETGALVIGSEAGILHRAEPGLRSFQRIETFDGFSFFGIGDLKAGGDTMLVAFGFGDTYHRSRDDGVTWESMPLSEASTFMGGVRLPNGSLGVMGLGGVMVEIGPDGEVGRSRPLDARDPLGGATPVPGEDIVFVGVGGVQRVAAP